MTTPSIIFTLVALAVYFALGYFALQWILEGEFIGKRETLCEKIGKRKFALLWVFWPGVVTLAIIWIWTLKQ
jgi:hypothetical protein